MADTMFRIVFSLIFLSMIIQLTIPKVFFKKKFSLEQIWLAMKVLGPLFDPKKYFRKEYFIFGYVLYIFSLILPILAFFILLKFIV